MYFITQKQQFALILLHNVLTISQYMQYNFRGDNMYGIDINKEIKYKWQ